MAQYQNGRMSSVTRRDALNSQLSSLNYSYDAHGRQSQVTDARTGTTTFAYNAADQVVTNTSPDPDGAGPAAAQVTATVYDTMGRVWQTGLPDGTWNTNEYHLTGLLRKTSGSRTYPVEYAYDHAGRMKTMTTWQNHASGTGAAVTTWNYHATRGWLASKRYADNLGPDYTYTVAGRLGSRTWARGLVTTNTYTTAGDLWTVNYSDGVTAGVTNSYDRRGRATGTSSGGTTTTRGYHDAGLLLSEAYSGGPLDGQAVRWNFDPLLRRSALLVSNATAGVLHQVSYGYDAASRLKGVTNGLSSAAYAYLANGPQVAQVAFSHNGQAVMTTTRSFDALDRLTAVTNHPAAAAPQSFRFAYNAANQRTAITNADSSKWMYTYDALGQVVSGKKQWSDGTPVAGQQFEYAFDDIGNRKTASVGQASSLSTYTANALNQYTSRSVPGYVPLYGTAASNATVTIWGSAGATPVSPAAPAGATARKGDYFWKEFAVDNASAPAWASFTNIGVLKNAGTNGLDIVATNTGSLLVAPASVMFTNDADGNLLTDGLWDYTWDGENRLVKIESRTNVPAAGRRKVELAYDAQSRLVYLRESAWNTSTLNYQLTNTLNFISDGWQCVVELDGTNNAYRRGYTWGLDLSGTTTGAGGVGGLLVLNTATNGAHCYAYDGNGNVAGLVAASGGQWTAEYEYSPFGQTLRATGPLARENPYRFSTKRTESASGLVLYEYRPYHVDLGRWLGRDPIGERGGKNLSAFVENSPIRRIDKLGLWGCTIGKIKEPKCVLKLVSGGTTPEIIEAAEGMVVLAGQMDVFARAVAAAQAAASGPLGAVAIVEAAIPMIPQVSGLSSPDVGQMAQDALDLLRNLRDSHGVKPFTRIEYKECECRSSVITTFLFGNTWVDKHTQPWKPYTGTSDLGGGLFLDTLAAALAGGRACEAHLEEWINQNRANLQ